MNERIAVVGLGYVGLPVAVAFARKFPGTVGFDIDAAKVAELALALDRNGEIASDVLRTCGLEVTCDVERMRSATFYVVAVPTPVDRNNVPDLSPVERASATVAKVLKRGDVVVFESTVYPGVTEDICAKILADKSGLPRDAFRVGYSPERINPGDKQHTLERIVKVVSGEDEATLERVADAYQRIIDAGIHRAPSVRVAEAAKVIENAQRDINIALMNELAVIFEKMGVRTADVLAAASTKWNFLRFQPGLVGGHCIGVDPYYLTMKAQQLGYQPEVILAGRRINNSMAAYLAQRTVKMLVNADIPVKGARVGVLGVTFKENCSDLRNSKVPDIVKELTEFGVRAFVHDAKASPADPHHEYGLKLCALDELRALDAVIVAVAHDEYRALGVEKLAAMVREGGVFVDVKSMFAPSSVTPRLRYTSL